LLPKVTKSGNFYLPENCQNWQFLSSAIVLQLLLASNVENFCLQEIAETSPQSTSAPTINTL